MGLSSKDRAFNTKKVSYLDFKQIEMDRVLTALFARLAHNGYPSRLKRRFELRRIRDTRGRPGRRRGSAARYLSIRPLSP